MRYQIRRGDTLSAIAGRYGTSVQALARANGIRNVNLIHTGAVLNIPGKKDSYSPPRSSRSSSGSSRPASSGSGAPTRASAKMQHLASVGRRTASRMNTRGWCARGVFNSLAAAGMPIRRSPSAYMAANTLAHDRRFREVRLTDAQIRRLPPGCIVVSGPYNSPGNPHGHIAITLGNGMESSDHVQRLGLNGTQRVFIPR